MTCGSVPRWCEKNESASATITSESNTVPNNAASENTIGDILGSTGSCPRASAPCASSWFMISRRRLQSIAFREQAPDMEEIQRGPQAGNRHECKHMQCDFARI